MTDLPTPQPEPVTPPPAPAVDTKAIASAARKEATEKMVADLGCSPAEAKQILDQVRAAGEAQKSETQRSLDAAAIARAEAEQIRSEAVAERQAIKVERKLLAAGVTDAALADVVRIVNVAPDADDDTITAAVNDAKTRLPVLFAPAPGTPPPAPGVRPAVAPPAGTSAPGRTLEDIGRENAARLGIKVVPPIAS